MLRRISFIENRRVLADSGEITVNIGLRDPITAIWLEFRATNGALQNCANTIAENITSVELIDGAKTLTALTGVQLAALYWERLGYMPYQLIDELQGNFQNLNIPIMFGRWLGDTVYAFDPSKFSNPQIRLRWNLATKNAVGANGFATGTANITLVADIMEGAPSPQAMLSARQHYSFATAAAGTEYIDMPTDQRIKALMVRSWSLAHPALSGIANLKLTCDNDKFVVFQMRSDQFINWNELQTKPLNYKHFFVLPNARTAYAVLKMDETIHFTRDAGDTTVGYLNYGMGEGAVTVITGGVADVNPRVFVGLVSGFCPYGASLFNCGEWDDPASWLDLTSFRSVRLELGQDHAADAASVVIESELIY